MRRLSPHPRSNKACSVWPDQRERPCRNGNYAMNVSCMAPNRRAFTFGISAAAGGIILGVHPIPSFADQSADLKHEAQGSESEITAWVVIESDDTTIIR